MVIQCSLIYCLFYTYQGRVSLSPEMRLSSPAKQTLSILYFYFSNTLSQLIIIKLHEILWGQKCMCLADSYSELT